MARGALGEYQEAVSYLERGIALAQETGTLRQEGRARKGLGIVGFELGRHDEAAENLNRALTLLRLVGHRPQQAETLLALGDVLAAQGQYDAAHDAWQQASLIFSTFHLPDGESLPQAERVRERLLTPGRSPGVPAGETTARTFSSGCPGPRQPG